MAKPPSLLAEAETLLASLLREANETKADAIPEEGKPPPLDFRERLMAVDAATRFLIVKNKLAPPEKEKSGFEEMMSDLHSGTPGSRARTPAKGKSAVNGVAGTHATDPS